MSLAIFWFYINRNNTIATAFPRCNADAFYIKQIPAHDYAHGLRGSGLFKEGCHL